MAIGRRMSRWGSRSRSQRATAPMTRPMPAGPARAGNSISMVGPSWSGVAGGQPLVGALHREGQREADDLLAGQLGFLGELVEGLGAGLGHLDGAAGVGAGAEGDQLAHGLGEVRFSAWERG